MMSDSIKTDLERIQSINWYGDERIVVLADSLDNIMRDTLLSVDLSTFEEFPKTGRNGWLTSSIKKK